MKWVLALVVILLIVAYLGDESFLRECHARGGQVGMVDGDRVCVK